MLGAGSRSTPCCTSPARRRRSTSRRCPIQILKVGSLGTHNSLGLAHAKGAQFLLASTSEVYGDPLVHPQPETYWGNVNPIGPRGVYDEAKRFAEAMTMAYHRAHGLDVRIVRIFNTYGPRMRPDDGRVVSNFIVQALARRAAHDLRRRHPDPQLLLRRRPDRRSGRRSSTRATSGPVNIGNPDEFTVAQLAQLVHRDHGLSFDRRVPATSPRRPVAAAAGHHTGTRPSSAGNPRSMSEKGSPAQSTGSARTSLADREPGPRAS